MQFSAFPIAFRYTKKNTSILDVAEAGQANTQPTSAGEATGLVGGDGGAE